MDLNGYNTSISIDKLRGMPLSQKKVCQGRNKSLQAKLSDFTAANSSKKASANFEAMDSDEANASSTPEDKSSDRSNDTAEGESGHMAATILAAINDMKTEFYTKFDGILSAIESVRKDITDCAE